MLISAFIQKWFSWLWFFKEAEDVRLTFEKSESRDSVFFTWNKKEHKKRAQQSEVCSRSFRRLHFFFFFCTFIRDGQCFEVSKQAESFLFFCVFWGVFWNRASALIFSLTSYIWFCKKMQNWIACEFLIFQKLVASFCFRTTPKKCTMHVFFTWFFQEFQQNGKFLNFAEAKLEFLK